MTSKEIVTINLTKEKAIVLFELSSRFTDSDQLSIMDQAEEVVLWNLCTSLEKNLSEPFKPNWADYYHKHVSNYDAVSRLF